MKPGKAVDLSSAFHIEGGVRIRSFNRVDFLINDVGWLLLEKGAQSVQLESITCLLALVEDFASFLTRW